ncbi:hypothetical protein [Emticicia sp. SJ17W-69]|uniref:hypothetical protein n=1 Tax=Emticicia sp. SJ17W-69 TaxID=3421657 RepID=UPI003EBDEB5B
MKTEDFDEAFRRKVESFHPPFRDDEIDRIQGYVNKHIPMSFWQRFGHTFTYSLGTVIIVSLLTTIIYQANENKNLLNKVADLNNKLEQKQAVVAMENAPKSIIIEKTDTVYVVKHIRKEIPNLEEASSDNQLSATKDSSPAVVSKENINGTLSSNETTKDNTQEDFNLTNSAKLNEVAIASKQEKTILTNARKSVISSTKTDGVRQVSKLSNDTKSTEKMAEGNIIDSQPNAKKTLEKNDFKQNSNLSKPIQSNAVTVDNLANNTEKLSNLSENTSQENKNKILTINDLKRKAFSPIDLKFAFDLSNKKLHSPHYVANPKTRKSFKLPSISMPNLKYRVGIGANADFGQLGTSILTDILFAKRWSMTTGVNMSFLGFEHFGDEDDFKRRTDKDFRDEHDVVLPLSNSIENIDAHQVLLRLPIYLNYRLPLRKDYTVLFSTGTDLDFHLNQITSFSHHDLVRDERQEGIQEKIPVPLFNNWMISAGIEKRWKHFSVQLSPYLSYQIKPVSYRKEDFIFGFKANGFYRISR